MDIETNHELSINGGLLKVDKPNLSRDVVVKRLKPENITCAKCFQKYEKEGVI